MFKYLKKLVPRWQAVPGSRRVPRGAVVVLAILLLAQGISLCFQHFHAAEKSSAAVPSDSSAADAAAEADIAPARANITVRAAAESISVHRHCPSGRH